MIRGMAPDTGLAAFVTMGATSGMTPVLRVGTLMVIIISAVGRATTVLSAHVAGISPWTSVSGVMGWGPILVPTVIPLVITPSTILARRETIEVSTSICVITRMVPVITVPMVMIQVSTMIMIPASILRMNLVTWRGTLQPLVQPAARSAPRSVSRSLMVTAWVPSRSVHSRLACQGVLSMS